MKLVGLTGQIGSGKSTVARVLRRRGFAIIDADAFGHGELNGQPGSYLYAMVASAVSTALVNGRIDSKLLAEKVFTDGHRKRIIERIIQPYVLFLILRKLLRLWLCGYDVVIIDIPLLFQTCRHRMINDCILVMTTYPGERLRRLGNRGMNEAIAMVRTTFHDDLQFDGLIVKNDGSNADLESKTGKLIK